MARLPSAANRELKERDFSDLPKGTKVIMFCEKSEYKPNSKKTGNYLSLQFKVEEGDYKGRVFFVNLNLDNPNAQAEEIAWNEFYTIALACGMETVPDDSEDIHNISIEGTADGKGGFTTYKPAGGARPKATQAAAGAGGAPKRPKVNFN